MQSFLPLSSRPAVVLGGELNGLGVCRSLARGGVPVYVLDWRRCRAAMWSRHAIPVRTPALHGAPLLDALLSLQNRLGGRPALIITDEMAALTVSESRDRLGEFYRFRLPPHDTVMMLHNKAQFHEFALTNGFAVPRGEVLRKEADMARIRRLHLPVFIKPADKRFFHASGEARLVIARDRKTADEVCRRLVASTGEVIVQEGIEGADDCIYFCLFYRAPGLPTVTFTGRKLASSPPGSGSTALCTRAEEHVSLLLEAITQSLLEKVDYQGLGSVEYKWDAGTGRFLIIEPTVGRTDWQEEIASLCGVNIPLASYCHEYGIAYAGSGASGWPVWQASFVERVKVGGRQKPFGSPVVDGYWRRDDPFPALIHYPREMLVSTPAMLKSIARRYGHLWGRQLWQLGCRRRRA